MCADGSLWRRRLVLAPGCILRGLRLNPLQTRLFPVEGGQTAEQPALSAFRGVAASDKNRKGGYFPMRAGAETSVPRHTAPCPGSANALHAGFIVHKERLVVEPPRPTS